MKLNFEQITSVCLGTVRAAETDRGVRLYRFTEEQEELYRQRSEDFYKKSFATAGMKLLFETDSETLFLKVNVSAGGSSRRYFSFDVAVNGEMVGYLDNFSGKVLPKDYTQVELPLGEFSRNFALGSGKKRVCIYLPWSVIVELEELSIDDGACITPVKPSKKLIAFGDSITHGYDALRPSNRYAAKLAEALEAEEINKGIGGEVFFPALAKACDTFSPDYITVAYGTNDWSKTEEGDFKERCFAFYEALSRNYPDAKIFAITPIWRKDCQVETAFGSFGKVAEDIRTIVENFENITCICGYDFIPEDENYFGDLRLHPNDRGFEQYAHNLGRQIGDKL